MWEASYINWHQVFVGLHLWGNAFTLFTSIELLMLPACPSMANICLSKKRKLVNLPFQALYGPERLPASLWALSISKACWTLSQEIKRQGSTEHSLDSCVYTVLSRPQPVVHKHTHTHKTWRGFLMVWMGGSWKTRVRREPREADSAINPSNNLMKEHVVPAVVPPFPSNQTSLSSPKGLKKETAGWTTRSFKKPKDSQISGIPVRHHSNSILPRNLEVSLSLYFLTIEMEMILPFSLPDRQQVKETKNLKILYKLQLAIQAWGLIITILMGPAKHIEKVLQQYTWGQQVASRTGNKERRQHWFRHGFSKLPFTRGLGTWWDK